jgi:membrane dipeptidase
VTAVNATIAAWHNMPETINIIADLYAHFEMHRDLVMLVRSVDDIARAKATGKVGMVLGFQDSRPLEDNLNLLRVYHALGVRIIQLTYNECNLVGCGCLAPEDTGLTEFGRAVVAEMNRLGMLIDVSHCGQRTTWEAIETSNKPVAITHSNPRVRCDHPRNKSDEVIRALAARGGVIGAVSFPAMVTGRMDATLDDYLNMIDYLVELVGSEHVGVGPDFMEKMPPEVLNKVLAAGREGPPAPEVLKLFQGVAMTGLESASAFANITNGLLARGYTETDTKKIMGENWLHLYREVWNSSQIRDP